MFGCVVGRVVIGGGIRKVGGERDRPFAVALPLTASEAPTGAVTAFSRGEPPGDPPPAADGVGSGMP